MANVLVPAINIFAWVLSSLIFIRIILSWIRFGRSNPLIQLVYSLTEPILGPIRELLYKSPLGGPGMMLDFSPVIAYFLIEAVRRFLIILIISL